MMNKKEIIIISVECWFIKHFAVINPYLPNGLSLSHHLDEPISNLRVDRHFFFCLFLFHFELKFLEVNSGNADQTPHSEYESIGLDKEHFWV